MAIVSSVVATGRAMKGAEMFMPAGGSPVSGLLRSPHRIHA